VTSSLLAPNILLNTLFSNIGYVCIWIKVLLNSSSVSHFVRITG
jgi:hypothetical protein